MKTQSETMDDVKNRETWKAPITGKLLTLGQNLLLQRRMTNAKAENPNKSDFISDPTMI